METSNRLIRLIQKQHDITYGKFHSVMPRALKGTLIEHIRNDDDLCQKPELEDEILSYLTYELIDTIWDTIGEELPDITEEAKSQFNLVNPVEGHEEDQKFSDMEQEYRDEGL